MTAVSTAPMRRGSAVVPSNDTGRKSPESPRGTGCRWRFDGRLTERQRGTSDAGAARSTGTTGRPDHDPHDHRLPRDAERLRVLGHLARRTRRADRARGPPRRGRPPAHRWPRPARRATRRDAPGCGPAQLARRLRPGRRVHHRSHRRMGADPGTPDQGPRAGPPDALVGARRGPGPTRHLPRAGRVPVLLRGDGQLGQPGHRRLVRRAVRRLRRCARSSATST